MRFAESGYYIERYVKCENCGVLIYREPLKSTDPVHAELEFCTDWCIDWFQQKAAGAEIPSAADDFAS